MTPAGWRVVGDLSPFRPDLRRYGPYRTRLQAQAAAWWHVFRYQFGAAWILPPGVDMTRDRA